MKEIRREMCEGMYEGNKEGMYEGNKEGLYEGNKEGNLTLG